ncbi:uroporphyrinogen-III synthase [compost metagenome]
MAGRGSEDSLRRAGHLADYVGEGGDIEEVAELFAEEVSGKTVLFPRAQDSLLSIQKALKPDTKVVDLPIYETVIEEDIDQTYADVLIFTSPSNVDAYFVDNLLEPGQQVIAIGNSTAKKFDEMGVKYVLPYSPDEIGLAEAVFGIEIK